MNKYYQNLQTVRHATFDLYKTMNKKICDRAFTEVFEIKLTAFVFISSYRLYALFKELIMSRNNLENLIH